MSLHQIPTMSKIRTRRPRRRKTRTTSHPRFLRLGEHVARPCWRPQQTVRSAAVRGPLRPPHDSVNTPFSKIRHFSRKRRFSAPYEKSAHASFTIRHLLIPRTPLRSTSAQIAKPATEAISMTTGQWNRSAARYKAAARSPARNRPPCRCANPIWQTAVRPDSGRRPRTGAVWALCPFRDRC